MRVIFQLNSNGLVAAGSDLMMLLYKWKSTCTFRTAVEASPVVEVASLLHVMNMPSSLVPNWVMKELRKLDKVAYVRFASVYRSFDDVSEFVAAIKETGKKAGKSSDREDD